MKLEEMPTRELLALHNRIADKPAGPKTFATRATSLMVARLPGLAWVVSSWAKGILLSGAAIAPDRPLRHGW